MHGRVKVRTSEEEKARKDRERQEKLKIFKHAMQKIQYKRNNSELDKELMELTGKVLSSNPDIYTIWNIRREILNIFRKKNQNDMELSQMFNTELQLTEHCLKINPKSYCAWHQREWVLTTRTDPDWSTELDLCNTYLKLDSRNFHTWDYRRFVVSQCKQTYKDEFDYTTEKLMENFSNYSAWHYRSKMLVEIYPDLEGGRPIEDSHHKHELKMVQSAAFTDPDDTSAWFYQRWLLGAVKRVIRLVSYTVSLTKATFAFSQHVDENFVRAKTFLFINNVKINGEWSSCTGNRFDVIWMLKHETCITENLDVKVFYESENGKNQEVLGVKYPNAMYIGTTDIDFKRNYSKPVVEELINQLEACRQLLLLEPNSKWTLLTTTVFLHCIDPRQNYNEVIENLKVLKVVDKSRVGYYNDLMTKWTVEKQLYDDFKNPNLNFKMKLIEHKITSLPHLQYYSYCTTVDLSHQELTSKVLPSLIVLQHCKKLSLENNKLTTLKSFPVLQLEELNIKGNEDLRNDEVELFKSKHTINIIY